MGGTQRAGQRLLRRRQVRGHVVDRLNNPSSWTVDCNDDGDDLAYPAHCSRHRFPADQDDEG